MVVEEEEQAEALGLTWAAATGVEAVVAAKAVEVVAVVAVDQMVSSHLEA